MSHRRVAWAALALLAGVAYAQDEVRENICPDVVLVGAELELSETEKKLVCGDPENETWRHVPLNQVRYLLRAFLQQRGYHRPEFEPRGEGLLVRAGPLSVISKMTAEGLPPEIEFDRWWAFEGRVLTPTALDEIQAQLVSALKETGHGCPRVKAAADSETGEVRISAEPGPVHVLTREDIVMPALSGIDPRVFDRFRAFEYGKPVDARLLTVTATRIVWEELFLSASYGLGCDEASNLKTALRVTRGKSKLVGAAVGFDTEEFLRARVRWRHSRIGPAASSVESALYASFRRLTLEGVMSYYPNPASRLFLAPIVKLERRREPAFETNSAQVKVIPTTTFDDQRFHFLVGLGPALEHIDTTEGFGPTESFLSFDGHADAMSHMYEYYLNEPQMGWEAVLDTSVRFKGLYSDHSERHIVLNPSWLWNIGRWRPPRAVFGWRARFGTTEAPGVPVTSLHPESTFFLGGSQDLRGFARQELPLGASSAKAPGFLTVAYQSFELRAGDILPARLQPFVFFDAAMGGATAWKLDPDVYYSPGLGLRWRSPFGPLRLTAARDYIWDRDGVPNNHQTEWQFYFSFGEEF